MEPAEQPAPIPHINELALPEIQELDLSGKSLPQLQIELTKIMKTGKLIHGSRTPDISQLEPQLAHDNRKGDYKAVFASYDPLLALAFGTMDGNYLVQKKHILFFADQNITPHEHGYVYVLPNTSFTPHPDSRNEFVSEFAVRPDLKIKFDTKSVRPLIRDYKDAILDANADIVPAEIRQIDMQASLLCMRNLLELTGFVDDRTDGYSPSFAFLNRLATVTEDLAPVLKQIKITGDESNKQLAKSVFKLYMDCTYDAYNSSMAVQQLDRAMTPIVNQLDIR